jgi:hypothetical protein
MIVKLLAFLLILGAVHVSRLGGVPVGMIGALVMAICGIGLLFLLSWARYLWYVLAAAASGAWLVIVALYPGKVAGFSPGWLLLVLCIGGSIAVRREYRHFSDR